MVKRDGVTNLVAGGAGFIGSHLCEALLRRGERVICLDNFQTGSAANLAHLAGHGRFRLVEADITVDKVECITRAQNAQRNHPRNKSPELAKLCQLKGAITRQVNRITQEATA